MYTRIYKHYLPLILMVLLTGTAFYIKRGNRDLISFIALSTGFISIVILSFSLIMGSMNLLFKLKNPVSSYLRRDISITGGAIGIVHSITGLFVHLRGKPWLYFLNHTDHGYSIKLDNFGLANYTGLLAALIIIILIITSNDYSLKRLTPLRWKNFQRLSYLMFILVLVHCYFYRIGKENLAVFLWFYLPLLIITVSFQIAGFCIRAKRNQN